MAQHIKPFQTLIKVVPRDSEIEITLNINITVDGGVINCALEKVEHEKEKKNHLIPDFSSGLKLDFGKSC